MSPVTTILLTVGITIGLFPYNNHAASREGENKIHEKTIPYKEDRSEYNPQGKPQIPEKRAIQEKAAPAFLHEACGPGYECTDPYTVCRDVCVCMTGFEEEGGSCLLKASIRQSCGSGIKCVDAHTVCSDVCVCDASYVEVCGSCHLRASLSEACGPDIECVDSNTVCSAGVCVCETDYVTLGGSCQPGVPIGGSCTEHAECYERCSIDDDCSSVGPMSVCSNGACTCEEKVFNAYGICYKAVFVSATKKYGDAQSNCEAMASGANLITIPSIDVANYLNAMYAETANGRPWIGLRENNTDHAWRTGDILQLTDYQPWLARSDSSLTNTAKCIHMDLALPVAFMDASCGYKKSSFCMLPVVAERQIYRSN